ncbi:MAG TPA: metallophosphoesterase [Thermoanaerobaculia bacterium]|nr:metallophosphoesterase [Thermoanaerobaculia bacterium]
MSHIETHSHPVASLFQSLAETVSQRIDEHKNGASDSAQSRPTVGDPMVDVANTIAGYITTGEDIPKDPTAELVAKHGAGIKDLWDCASISAQLLDAKAKGDTAKAAQLEDELKFSTCDPHWIEAITQYVDFFGLDGKKGEIPYVRYQQMDDFVINQLPKNARIALVGDWGTGTEDAIDLLKQVAKHNPDVLIHLGDIYYAGTPDECQKYFLDIVDQVFDRTSGRVPAYTLCGNHDVYSGGVGYYGILPKLNPAPPFATGWAQQASYFALRSPRWQLLAMDTGLHDQDPFHVVDSVTYLDPQEEAWHVDKIRSFSEGGGRTILLSHHQLFSAFSGIGKGAINENLQGSWQKFQAAGGASGIAGWFWGHEHNLCVYEPFAGLQKGRCIGHGAIPAFLSPSPYQPLANIEPLPALVDAPGEAGKKLELATSGSVYDHGFAILELDDDALTAKASYYQSSQPDQAMFVEQI